MYGYFKVFQNETYVRIKRISGTLENIRNYMGDFRERVKYFRYDV
jgi:hypothetical protein